MTGIAFFVGFLAFIIFKFYEDRSGKKYEYREELWLSMVVAYSMLEQDGFVPGADAVRTRQEVIEAVLPLTVNMKDRTYDMMGNVTCAAAAVTSGVLMKADDFCRYYREGGRLYER